MALRGTEPGRDGAQRDRSRWVGATTVATAAMSTGMLALYAVSALGPFLVTDLRLPRSAVGALVTGMFTVACAASLVAGRVVDTTGPRRGVLGLAGLVLVALLAAAAAPGYGLLLVALALTGFAQAMANPATNLLVVSGVPGPRRGVAIGVKQSGVQLSAFAAGLALPPLAAVAGWRAGMLAAAALPAVLLVVVWWTVPRDSPARAAGPWLRWPWSGSSPWLPGLMGFSLLLGVGLATVNTYLPLYASQQAGLSGGAAGSVLAAFGVSGLVARVLWTRVADRLTEVMVALRWLSLAAAGCTLLLPLAATSGVWLIWAGAIGVGATATAANAVSMLAVVRRGGATGHASALVSLGFFGGFVLGPVGSGLLADRVGWPAVWLAVAVMFTAAGVVGAVLSRAGRDPVAS